LPPGVQFHDTEFHMSPSGLKTVALAVSALALGLGAQAQGTSSSASAASAVGTAAQGARSAADAKRADVARADRRFIETAAMSGMTEVAMGKIAQQKAGNAQVKEFAQRMVADHGKANEELMSLASRKGVQAPAALDRSHRNEVEKLGKRSGADFDRDYVAHQVTDHRKAVSDFKKAADSVKDPDLKAWAAKTLPTLEEHYKMAQALHDSMKGTGKAATGTSKS
jgi:putative membrane protein